MSKIWKITKVHRFPLYNSKEDVVHGIEWELYDEESPEVKLFGNTGIALEESEFTPFSELTEEQLLQWVKSIIDVDWYENELLPLQTTVQPTQSLVGMPWDKE